MYIKESLLKLVIFRFVFLVKLFFFNLLKESKTGS